LRQCTIIQFCIVFGIFPFVVLIMLVFNLVFILFVIVMEVVVVVWRIPGIPLVTLLEHHQCAVLATSAIAKRITSNHAGAFIQWAEEIAAMFLAYEGVVDVPQFSILVYRPLLNVAMVIDIVAIYPPDETVPLVIEPTVVGYASLKIVKAAI